MGKDFNNKQKKDLRGRSDSIRISAEPSPTPGPLPSPKPSPKPPKDSE